MLVAFHVTIFILIFGIFTKILDVDEDWLFHRDFVDDDFEGLVMFEICASNRYQIGFFENLNSN